MHIQELAYSSLLCLRLVTAERGALDFIDQHISLRTFDTDNGLRSEVFGWYGLLCTSSSVPQLQSFYTLMCAMLE